MYTTSVKNSKLNYRVKSPFVQNTPLFNLKKYIITTKKNILYQHRDGKRYEGMNIDCVKL